jgi:hypothetical protein
MQQSIVPVRLFHNSLSPQLFSSFSFPAVIDLGCLAAARKHPYSTAATSPRSCATLLYLWLQSPHSTIFG